MCGEKRSLRQVDRALGAMFSNVGLHPVSLTQTIGSTLGDLTGESTSVIPLSPSQGASLQQVMSAQCSQAQQGPWDDSSDQPEWKRPRETYEHQPDDTFNKTLRQFREEIVDELTEKFKTQVEQGMKYTVWRNRLPHT